MEKLYQILNKAIASKVTDIHLNPKYDDQSKDKKDSMYEIIFRRSGEIYHFDVLTNVESIAIINHLKYECHLDVTNKHNAQSGQMSLKLKNKQFNIRVSTLPLFFDCESISIRILYDSEHDNKIEYYNQSQFETLKKASLLKDGLIIISGPTGSGKTTLLYELIEHVNSQWNRRILTIEDPVERHIIGALQVNLNDQAGISYEESVKAFMRCDPDIILIGEIRDAKTAKEVVRASLSGHLVLTTIHAQNATGVIHRMLEFGVGLNELMQSLTIINNQRLIRLADKKMTIISEQLNFKNIKLDQMKHLNEIETVTIHEQVKKMFLNKEILPEEYEAYVLDEVE
ncbi:competence type IV pilus ATPase ComGA [Abyssicoccus albus]|uniref:Competence protein ComGA n=1 Tax=Abyssicoccus albus TaxID=1817405 RepID=A0A3N5BJP5_9BACL|nr:competence type IV pilus ATPase ComGA [Abyssicoccus albus]RPF58096.1 competence protein ComGA [Abyssicoccus albus]